MGISLRAGGHSSRIVVRLTALLLSAVAAFAASAQEVSGIKVAPLEAMIGDDVSMEVLFKRQDRPSACAVMVNWGDGDSFHSRLDSDRPNSATHAYPREGSFTILVEPKTMLRGLKSTGACDGAPRTQVVTIRDPAKVLAAKAAREREIAAQAAAEAARIAAEKRQAQQVAEAEAARARAVAEAAEAARLRDTVDAAFLKSLAGQNAGQLYATADRMIQEGKPQHAREALRSLIARFPNHPLAAPAARLLATLPPAPVAPTPTPPRGAGDTPSACKIAFDKQEAETEEINQRLKKEGPSLQLLQMLMHLLEERLALLDRLCRGEPQYARHASIKKHWEQTRDSCKKVATSAKDCAPKNPPPGSPATPDTPAPAPTPGTPTPGKASGPSACKIASEKQAAEFNAINKQLPTNGPTIPLLQTTMYMLSERIALLNRLCRGEPEYEEFGPTQYSLTKTMETCKKVASSDSLCVPKLNIAEAQAPAPIKTPPKPAAGFTKQNIGVSACEKYIKRWVNSRHIGHNEDQLQFKSSRNMESTVRRDELVRNGMNMWTSNINQCKQYATTFATHLSKYIGDWKKDRETELKKLNGPPDGEPFWFKSRGTWSFSWAWNSEVSQSQMQACLADVCLANEGFGAGPPDDYPAPAGFKRVE